MGYFFRVMQQPPIKEFFKELYTVEEDTEHAIQAMAYAESLVFFKAFSSSGSASLVRKAMSEHSE